MFYNKLQLHKSQKLRTVDVFLKKQFLARFLLYIYRKIILLGKDHKFRHNELFYIQ